MGLFTQKDLLKSLEKAERKILKEKKDKKKIDSASKADFL